MKEDCDKKIKIKAYAKGLRKALSDVRNLVFSRKMLGDGLAIVPDEGFVYAPCDGVITSVYDTNHAIGLNVFGLDLLIHIGIDTVHLMGEGFIIYVSEGDRVSQGQKIGHFDLDILKKYKKDSDIIMIMTNAEECLKDYTILDEGRVSPDDVIIKLNYK